MNAAERVRAAFSRYDGQGFASVRLDTLAVRAGVTEGAVIAEAGRAGVTVARWAGSLWVVLQPKQRDRRPARYAAAELEDREDALARAGAGR